jgi:hypothetical protein
MSGLFFFVFIRRLAGPSYGCSELRGRTSPPCDVADGPPELILADWDWVSIWADGRLPCSTGAGPGFATLLLEVSVIGLACGTRLATLRSPCASAELETTPNTATAKTRDFIRKLLRVLAASIASTAAGHDNATAGRNHQPCSQP